MPIADQQKEKQKTFYTFNACIGCAFLPVILLEWYWHSFNSSCCSNNLSKYYNFNSNKITKVMSSTHLHNVFHSWHRQKTKYDLILEILKSTVLRRMIECYSTLWAIYKRSFYWDRRGFKKKNGHSLCYIC